MRLEWLEDILAIAKTGSFSGAAERRRLTQSAFSRRVQQIEDYVGVELFDRSHKPVHLRPTTLAQSGQIEQISTAMRQLVVDLRRGDRIASNKIVIASQHSLTISLAPAIIQAMQHHDEGVYVRLHSVNFDECFSLLLSRQADVSIVYRLLDESNEIAGDFLETIDIGTDRFVPVFAEDLTERFGGSAAEVDIPYIAYPADVFFGKVMESNILPFLQPTALALPKAESALTLVALEMAAVGIAVAWVPKSLAFESISNGRIVDLSEVLPSCELRVKAVRLRGKPRPVEVSLWAQLIEMGKSSLALREKGCFGP